MTSRLATADSLRRQAAWLVGAAGVALLAWLSLFGNWLFPLALTVAVAGGLALLRWPWIGFLLLVASVPVQQLGAVGPLTLTRAAIPAALVGGLIWLCVKRAPVEQSRFALPFALWIAWIAFAAIDSGDQGAAGAEVSRWLIAFLAFLLAFQFLAGAPERRILALAIVLALAGALEAMIGTILSLLQAGPQSFQVGDAFSRAFGTFGRPNTFAGYLEITVFPVAWLAIEQARRLVPVFRAYQIARREGMVASRIARRRLFRDALFLAVLGGSSLIMLAGITFSYSRGAWVGVAAGVAFTGLVFLKRIWPLVLAAAPVALLAIVVAASTIAPASFTDRITSVSGELRLFDAATITLTDDNFAVAERMAHWQAGWRMFEDNPVTGVGPGNFNPSYDDYFNRSQFRFTRGHAHNYYIHVLSETGIVGLALYLVLALGFLLLGATVAWHAPTGMSRALALGATGSMVAILVHNVFENLHVLNLGISISVVWALAVAAHRRWRFEQPAA